MKFSFDTDTGILTTQAGAAPDAAARQMPLYSREAFELLSREWVRCGWALGYYFTMTWFGRPILQLPEDLVRLQEVLVTLQPDVIIETGICYGGSLLFHASICEALGKGRVIGVDLNIPADTRAAITGHRLSPRIRMIEGDAIAPATVDAVRQLVRPGETVLVILDSNHTKAHVAGELEAYSGFVTPGSCIVAADGIMRDLTDVPGGDPSWTCDNPAAAAHDFIAAHPEFEMRQPAWPFNNSTLEQNITYWPDGWLWRKS
jgi:cephalosporin hydroxylase